MTCTGLEITVDKKDSAQYPEHSFMKATVRYYFLLCSVAAAFGFSEKYFRP
jgi:hypothetical protein